MKNHNELLASQRVLSMLESAGEYSEQILDNIPSVFVALNQANRVIRANKAFCDLVGHTMESALHQDFAAFFTHENRAILLHHLNHMRSQQLSGAAAEGGSRLKLEFGGTTPDQAARPFIWRIFPLEHLSQAEGRVMSVVGDDLSGLYQSELKLMSIFSSLPLGLMVLDGNGLVTEVLSEYCHVLLNQRQLTGDSLRRLLEQHNPDLRQDLNQAFSVLQSCVGAPLAQFSAREAELAGMSQIKVEGEGGERRWLRPRFQAIAKNEKVDRYMVILEDITTSYLAQMQIERADILGKQAQALYECAIRDPLSGLYTRLFMSDSVSRLVSSAKRGKTPELSLAMFDLDNFKSVNDTYGHDAGDQVIKAFGRIIQSCIRDTDIAVRYGGEEFVIAVPSNDGQEQGGPLVAERIRALLAASPVDIGDGRSLTVTTSCGVSVFRQGDTLETLIQRADKHLYAAKHAGRNRVCVQTESGD